MVTKAQQQTAMALGRRSHATLWSVLALLLVVVLLGSAQFLGTDARLSHHRSKRSSAEIAPARFRRQPPNELPPGGPPADPSDYTPPVNPPDWRDPAIMTDSQSAFLTALRAVESRHTDAQPVEIAWGFCLKFWPPHTVKVGGQIWNEDGSPATGTHDLVPAYLGPKDKGTAIRDDIKDSEVEVIRNNGITDATDRVSTTTHSFAAVVAIEGRRDSWNSDICTAMVTWMGDFLQDMTRLVFHFSLDIFRTAEGRDNDRAQKIASSFAGDIPLSDRFKNRFEAENYPGGFY